MLKFYVSIFNTFREISEKSVSTFLKTPCINKKKVTIAVIRLSNNGGHENTRKYEGDDDNCSSSGVKSFFTWPLLRTYSTWEETSVEIWNPSTLRCKFIKNAIQ